MIIGFLMSARCACSRKYCNVFCTNLWSDFFLIWKYQEYSALPRKLVYLTTSWTNLTLHFLTWCNYAAQLHPSLGKVKGKGKLLLNSKWKNYFHGLYIFKVLNWLMSQYRKTIETEFFLKAHSPLLEMILFWK